MDRPVLLIGLGGSGGRTLRLVKRELQEQRLRRRMADESEVGLQMLHIDLPATMEPADRPLDGGIDLEPHEYLGLASVLPAGSGIAEVLSELSAIPGSEYELEGWLPSPHRWAPGTPRGPLRRAEVRAVGLRALPEIHRALSAALARIRRATGPESRTMPILVGSIAGATGSAIVRDLLETLAQIDRETSERAVTILYTPDVFPAHMVGPHMQARALATITELLSLAWSHYGADGSDPTDPDDVPPRRNALRSALLPGFDAPRLYLRDGVFLFGATDTRGISHVGHDGPYLSAARLITAIATSPSAADSLLAERYAGWGAWSQSIPTQSADVVTNLGHVGEAAPPLLDALGYTRLSVGTEEWRRYAAQILAGDTAAMLANQSPEKHATPLSIDGPYADLEAWDAEVRARVIERAEREAAQHGLAAAARSIRELLTRATVDPHPAIRSLGPGLLEPLLGALEDGIARIKSESPILGRSWLHPSTEAFPSPDPERDVFTVIPSEDFPTTLRDLLIMSFGTDETSARQQAAQAIAAGHIDSLRLITSAEPHRHRTAGSDAPQTALPFALAVHCSAEDLIARAQQWLTQEGTPIAAFLAHDLRSFVSAPDGSLPGGTSKQNREDRLVNLLRSALAQSAPRAEFSEALMMRLHPRFAHDAIHTPGISSLPFRNHPLEPRIRDILGARFVYDHQTIERCLTQESVSPDFEIFTSFRHRVDMTTLSSLMKPIAAAELWMDRQRDIYVAEGRARPLDESLPLPTGHLRAMIRGWFTGRVLGLIDTRTDPWTIVHDPLGNPRRVTFPAAHLSGRPQSTLDELPHALESISVAMLDVAATSSLAALDAYRALRDLGMSSPPDGELLRYPSLSPVLARWIATGESPGGDASHVHGLHPALAAAQDIATRRAALVDLLTSVMQERQRRHEEHVETDGRAVAIGERAPRWLSLADHIQASLAALLRATWTSSS